MKTSVNVNLIEQDFGILENNFERIAVFMNNTQKLDHVGKYINKLTKGALLRAIKSKEFEKKACGDILTLSFSGSLKADHLDIIKWSSVEDINDARKAGVNLAKKSDFSKSLICVTDQKFLEDFLKGYLLRLYKYIDNKTNQDADAGSVTLMLENPQQFRKSLKEIQQIVDGVFFTRNLVNEPANILTTLEFSNRLQKLSTLGVEVEVIEENQLLDLGMNALLGVGQGSANPSKVVIMSWKGGSKSVQPLALVGKGVVFDTGGISLKPAGGMEEMTMDMGGAGVVAGVNARFGKEKS